MNPIELDTLSDSLLAKVRRKKGHPFNPDRMARNLKTTREQLVEAVGRLTELGYSLKIDGRGRIIFRAAPDSFLPAEITNGLKTDFIGRRVEAYRSIQSTNLIAHRLAMSNAPEGTLVIAESQTRGRGRMGRSWHSPSGVGLYCSLILNPKIPPTMAPGISLMTAIVLAETIRDYGKIDVKIKWPNDVLVKGIKTAGILTELSAEIGRTNYVVVGVGVNINHGRGDFPKELKKQASSIRIGLGKKVNRVEFVQRFLTAFEIAYLSFKKHGLAVMRERILQYSSLLNTVVNLKMGRKTITGTVVDIDEMGHLVVETKNGLQIFSAGEVTSHHNR